MEETGLKITFIEGENKSTLFEGYDYMVLNYTPFSCSQNTRGNMIMFHLKQNYENLL